MDFNKLNYLMAIAELQSFSKAAKRCYVSQPALTPGSFSHLSLPPSLSV